MSKTPNDQLLYELIHSMTKAEKRSFKLFAKRNSSNQEAKYLRLFDVLEKMNTYNEKEILKKLSGVSKTQFANQKSHLYGLVLSSLRLSHLKSDVDIELREQLDYIRVLYKKGLYFQSLRLLNRAKKITGDYRKDLFQLSLLDYEKQIRSQQVFDLEEDYTEQIDLETDEAMQRFGRVQKFFSLASRMKARFVEKGMVKNDQEMNNLKALFYRNLPEYNEEQMAFNERFYLYRAFYWFSYLTYDFGSCVRYAEKWVKLFKDAELSQKRRSGYLKGLNRLLQSTFRIDDIQKFTQYFEELTAYPNTFKISTSNTHALWLKYYMLQSLNKVFLETNFEETENYIVTLLNKLDQEKAFVDRHNLLVIYYKAGVYYFALADYTKARHYLSLVIEDKDKLRTDLKGFARLIQILIDYDSGEEIHIDRKVKSTYLYFQQHKSLNAFQEIFLKFINETGEVYPQDLKKKFIELNRKLEKMHNEIYSKKLALYFDLSSWLTAKIENKSFAEVLQERSPKFN